MSSTSLSSRSGSVSKESSSLAGKKLPKMPLSGVGGRKGTAKRRRLANVRISTAGPGRHVASNSLERSRVEDYEPYIVAPTERDIPSESRELCMAVMEDGIDILTCWRRFREGEKLKLLSDAIEWMYTNDLSNPFSFESLSSFSSRFNSSGIKSTVKRDIIDEADPTLGIHRLRVLGMISSAERAMPPKMDLMYRIPFHEKSYLSKLELKRNPCLVEGELIQPGMQFRVLELGQVSSERFQSQVVLYNIQLLARNLELRFPGPPEFSENREGFTNRRAGLALSNSLLSTTEGLVSPVCDSGVFGKALGDIIAEGGIGISNVVRTRSIPPTYELVLGRSTEVLPSSWITEISNFNAPCKIHLIGAGAPQTLGGSMRLYLAFTSLTPGLLRPT